MVIHLVAVFGISECFVLNDTHMKCRAKVMVKLTPIIASNDAIEDQNLRLERKFGDYEKCVRHVDLRHL